MLYKHQLKDNDVCPAISREVARLDEEVRQIVKEVDKINYIKFVRKCLKEVRPTVKEIDKINYIKFVRKCLEEV
ncbi:MAG: hypothetical protein GY810_32385 [Aureispira sp.]|nr:hypothetical protein [Aureispira sp.]